MMYHSQQPMGGLAGTVAGTNLSATGSRHDLHHQLSELSEKKLRAISEVSKDAALFGA
jgi:hypothetical protein